MTKVQFLKEMIQSESLVQLYLASQQKLHRPLNEDSLLQMNEHKLLKKKPVEQIITKQDIVDFREQYEREQKIYSQMTLGYRYSMGIGGVEHKCRASVLYYEPAAYATTQYVLNTHGLDVVEKKKLKLGPYILESKLQIDERTHI